MDLTLTPGVYRFIMGRDSEPTALSIGEISSSLHDPFARLVLSRGGLPTTLRSLLAALESTNDEAEGLAKQQSFVVADGGQIPWSTETQDVARQFRFLIARCKENHTPDLFISTSTAIESMSTFLQVVGWDPVIGAFQFYDRRGGAWILAGSSWDALEPDTRGFGPFDSHVNGALNMKELKEPWINWHSQAATIDGALALDDPLRSEDIWKERLGAERLETEVVRPNIQRWTESRFSHRTVGGSLERLPELLGQILTTPTVNLIASPVESSQLVTKKTLALPLTFFVNSDALLNVLGLAPDISLPQVDSGVYLNCLTKFDVALTDGLHTFKGDTHFAFMVPEVAFEDITVLRGLIDSGIVTKKLAACLLMVDFCNPVFSPRRAALVQYITASATVGAAEAFSIAFVQAVEAASTRIGESSPEHEFLDNWRLADEEWQNSFEARIKAFFDNLAPRLDTLDGFAPVFQLAESRRREFRRRPLAEFRLTTPITNIPENAPLLEFSPDGAVEQKS
jgi:hypothetical protein